MTAALLCMSGLFAKKVAFIVDMSGQTVSPNGVHIAGNFQGWDPAKSTLINAPVLPPNAYGWVFDINANQVIEFKILNGNDWNSAENVPLISQLGSAANGGSNGNRWKYIDSLKNDTTLIMVKFSAAAPAGKSALRFAVDLQKETSVSANGVYVAGNFQGSNGASGDWKPNETKMSNLFSNNKVYEFIAYVDTTAGVEWKYLNGNDWPFNESVPSGCQKGGGNSNRFYQASGASKALDKVCFGSCIACATAPIPTYAFTFQVDMSNSDCDGGFDSVTVAGAGAKLTAFGAGLKMNKVGTTGVYSLTVPGLDSGEVNFKYRFHKNNNTNWEGGDNRILPLAKNDTAKITCFGSRVVGNCPSKPAPSKITFIVDFTKTTIPPANKIYIMGDFTKPQWQAGAREMTQITGKPGVYSAVIDSICPGKLAYRFSNGDPNTAGEGLNDSTVTPCVEPNGVGGFNRTYTRTVATDVTISKLWNSCSVGYMPGSGVSELANISNLVKLYPNPTSTFTVVEFNDAAKLHNVVMMDITGRVVRTIENYDLSTLRIDREDLKQGVYMINITNNLNQSANVKLVIE